MDRLFTGARCLAEGFRWLPRRGIRGPAFLPLLINVVLFTGLGWFAIDRFDDWLNRLLPDGLDWLEWLLWPLFVLLLIVIVVFTFTVVANLLAAPFNDFLADRVTRQLEGEKQPETGFSVLDIPGAVLKELRKLLYFATWAILLLALTFVPVINLALPFLWMVFACWCLAIEYSDYPLGRLGMKFSEQRRLLRENLQETIGFGAAVLGATLIPVINLAVIPAAVIGASLLWQKFTSENSRLPGGSE
jgi:CysZ protein